MKFNETMLPGVFIIELEPIIDERGFFARAWCHNEAIAHGLQVNFVQNNVSYNIRKGTIRGLHQQISPFEETKLVRCIRGGIYDVVLDLRPESPAYKKWLGVELSAEKRNAIYIPPGMAHGYQTLTDNAEVFYQVSQVYAPNYERGIRWNDPAFGIEWPLQPTVISEKDRSYRLFADDMLS
ncbi:MAG: dTDP-4-dehydrorhamnose 3,5-epimerase [candidate division KSB1 bacterium]|nr:dTDP-4-dehydrorhamnose 3,5-epimerase [candidate division KSB1 bacterium]MDZ7317978.1 dTDP-4-dehydrorhamnose 3,5-epimerase [candidate division KSB1 bacterium]MDZ7340665.1 dTDP-4-dehydrorhamnose 3,5-epimerase [candidate division KSB1 bacterium]